MSDQLRHSLDDCDELPTERSEPANDAERAELYKRMAFEADKEVKRLQAICDASRTELLALHKELRDNAMLAQKADNELAHWQKYVACRDKDTMNWPLDRGHLERCVDNARAALTKALEGWE